MNSIPRSELSQAPRLIRSDADGTSPALLRTAAIMATLALHLTFAVALIRSGTDAERMLAQQRAAQAPVVADLGSLPMITVVGRRAS